VVICLERGADLHMAQLLPLPLTVSCFSKIQIGFTFLGVCVSREHSPRMLSPTLATAYYSCPDNASSPM